MKNILILGFVVLFFGCNDESDIFTQSPSERMHNHIKTLEKELTEAPYGWKLIYFSRTDSLLFSTPQKAIKRNESNIERRIGKEGFGGYYFILKFQKGGKLSIRADYNTMSIENNQNSNYKIKQNSNVQLSFTTHNYLHKLVNERFRGASDFLYVGKDSIENLIFKTTNYTESAREYIVMEKLKNAKDTLGFLKKAYENRKLFENMKNPQLSIYRGSCEYFMSDVYLKRNIHNANEKFLSIIIKNRYYVFENDANPEEKLEKRKKGRFFGSGYVGTEKGLSFHSGFRWDKTIIFYDFVRVDNRFIAKFYDKIGVDTGYIAEIWDEEIND